MKCFLSTTILLCMIACAAPMDSWANENPSLCDQRAEGIVISTKINVRDHSREVLTLTLTNERDNEIKIRRQTLWRGNMVLLIASEKTGDVLDEDRFPDDLPYGDWTIRPGGSVSYDVDLTSRFPEMKTLREKETLILLWTLKIRYTDSTAKDRVGGYLALK